MMGTNEVLIPMNDVQLNLFAGLCRGVRDSEDPVTLRTLLVDANKILGSANPEWETVPFEKWKQAAEMFEVILHDTHLAPLIPEFLEALGVDVEGKQKDLSLLVINGRHKAEPLWAKLTDYAATMEGAGAVAAINPVGHYNDGEPRVFGLEMLNRQVDHLAIIASTQTQRGGSLEVLAQVMRLLREPNFCTKVSQVDIIIPMFGGSRGHRLGQSKRLGYEVLETISNPKILGMPFLNVMLKAWKEALKNDLWRDKNPLTFIKHLAGWGFPKIRFLSVDIHNDELPAQRFREMGFQFVSIDPSLEYANTIVEELRTRNLNKKRLRVIACDEGAIPRTKRLISKLAIEMGYEGEIELVCIDKSRIRAGEVADAKIGSIQKVSVGKKGELVYEEMDLKKYDYGKEAVEISSDDMLDTGGTAAKDKELLSQTFAGTVLRMFAATHAILSKGTSALEKIGADVFIVSNTLMLDGLTKRPDVRIVDMAPAIYRTIFNKKANFPLGAGNVR